MTDPLQPGDDGYLDLGAVSDEPLSPDEEAEFGAFAERVRAEGPVPGWQQLLRPEPPGAGPAGAEGPGDIVELRPGDHRSSVRARNGATRYWLIGAAAAVVLIGGFLLLRESGDEAAPVTDVADEVQPEPPARLALSVTGGNSHNCALDAQGDVWCWGLNGGRIGDGTTADTATPAKVGGNHVFTAVSAGSTHTCAIDDGGAMWCWGENSFGQLGNGTFEDATVPTAVVGDITFASLSTGGTFTCGIDIDGAAWCWGNNGLGATGRTGADSSEPGQVETDAGLVEIIAGGAHVCGITEDRALICWGNNSFGQLGIPDGFGEENPEGGATGSQLPATVPEISGIRQVALADWTTCVLEGNGQVTCWGHNEFGELADGTDVSRFEHQTVVDLWEVSQLSADGHHVCALGRQPDLACWGSNADGAIGPPSVGEHVFVPTEIRDLPLETDVVISGNWDICVLARGVPHCWGRNDAGQLGRGTVSDSEVDIVAVRGFGTG